MTLRRALLTVPLLLLLAACSSSAHPAASPSSAAADAGPAAAAAPVPKTPGIGDTVTLTATTGQKIAITLVKVVDPAKANYNPPEAGKHYVGVELKLVNTGTEAWAGHGAPTIGAKVLDASGQSYGPIIASTDAGQMFTSQVDIAAGGTALGAVTFQVPDGVKPVAVQIVLAMGAPFGQWDIG